MNKSIFLLLLISCFFSCNPTDDTPILETGKLYTDTFDQLEDFWITSEITDPSRAEIIQDPTDRDNHAIRFSLFPDDFINNGKRNELVINSNDNVGYKVNYSFKFMLPPDFFRERKHADWVMIHQWHDEPPYGLNWPDYDMQTHPPVNLTIKLTPEEDCLIVFNYGLWNKEINELQVANYKKPLTPNKWYTFENTIYWSYDDTGYSQPKIDGTYLFDNNEGKVYGANVYNEVGNYYKMGLYGNKKHRDTISIYFDDFHYKLTDLQPR